MPDRALSWGDLHNARDLGGLPSASGVTRFGRIFRSPRLDRLDAAGWEDVVRAGATTLVDLRNEGESRGESLRPPTVRVVRCPIEDQTDASFTAEWGQRLGSSAYYDEALKRWPGLIGAAIAAVADAEGGVVIHCSAGRDRTGLITAMLLELAHVDRDAILDDYELGVRETNDWLRAHPIPRDPARSDDELDTLVASARATLLRLLESVDIEQYLAAAGVTRLQLDRVRAKLLDP